MAMLFIPRPRHTGRVYWMPFASASSVQQDLEQGDKITTWASCYATTWHKYPANRCFTACAAVKDRLSASTRLKTRCCHLTRRSKNTTYNASLKLPCSHRDTSDLLPTPQTVNSQPVSSTKGEDKAAQAVWRLVFPDSTYFTHRLDSTSAVRNALERSSPRCLSRQKAHWHAASFTETQGGFTQVKAFQNKRSREGEGP